MTATVSRDASIRPLSIRLHGRGGFGAKTAAALSLNAYTGQVWYHTWHGTFVQEKEF